MAQRSFSEIIILPTDAEKRLSMSQDFMDVKEHFEHINALSLPESLYTAVIALQYMPGTDLPSIILSVQVYALLAILYFSNPSTNFILSIIKTAEPKIRNVG